MKAKQFNSKVPRKQRAKVLKRAHALMSRKGGWVRGNWKRALRKGASKPEDFGYCIQGACNQAAIELGYAVPQFGDLVTSYLSLEDLSQERYGQTTDRVNDTSSKKDRVLGLIETKLKELEA